VIISRWMSPRSCLASRMGFLQMRRCGEVTPHSGGLTTATVFSEIVEPPPSKRLLELEREQWRRECRADLVAFAVEALAPANQKRAAHHRSLKCTLAPDPAVPDGQPRCTPRLRLLPGVHINLPI
jgi:hypothetical protein